VRREGVDLRESRRRTPGSGRRVGLPCQRISRGSTRQQGGTRAHNLQHLLHHVDVDALERALRRLKRSAAPGVDGETVASYEQELARNLKQLHTLVHSGRYRPQPVRRVYIPKADGGQRPLGVTALEDKIVQGAVAEVISAIYEVDFLGFSYGFRPGRSPHDALAALHTAFMTQYVNWVLDADVRSFSTRLTTSGFYGWSRTGLPTEGFCGLFADGFELA
jgi:RNA-directed DNA polymerase